MTAKELKTGLSVNWSNWKTTATGVVLAVVTVLGAFGVFTPEQSSEVQTQSVNIFGAIETIIAAVSALVLAFAAKDGV